MALVPFHKRHRGEVAKLHGEIDDLFNGFFRGWDTPFLGRKAWPSIDVADHQDAVMVRAEVPGCKADDIDISVHGDTLTVSGEKKESQEQKEKGYYHVESSYGSFRRDLHLPSEIDRDKIEAACKDGILTIALPKAAKAKAVKVKVKGQ